MMNEEGGNRLLQRKISSILYYCIINDVTRRLHLKKGWICVQPLTPRVGWGGRTAAWPKLMAKTLIIKFEEKRFRIYDKATNERAKTTLNTTVKSYLSISHSTQ